MMHGLAGRRFTTISSTLSHWRREYRIFQMTLKCNNVYTPKVEAALQWAAAAARAHACTWN